MAVDTHGLASNTSTLTTTKLDELINGGMRRRASEAVRTTAFEVLGLAQSFAPVDTGYLKGSLQPGGADNVTEFSDNGLSATVGTAVSYANFQEFGTRRMSAQPFLSPAVELVRPAWVQRVSAIFGDQVLGL